MSHVQNGVYYLKPDGEHVTLELRVGDENAPLDLLVQILTTKGKLQVWIEENLVATVDKKDVRICRMQN